MPNELKPTLKEFFELFVKSIWLWVVDIYLNKSKRYSRKLTKSNDRAKWLLAKYDERWKVDNV